jgi:hypothetical protein
VQLPAAPQKTLTLWLGFFIFNPLTVIDELMLCNDRDIKDKLPSTKERANIRKRNVQEE